MKTAEIIAVIKEKATRRRDVDHEVEAVLSAQQVTSSTTLPLERRDRSLSVEELLGNFVELRPILCLKFVAAALVFLALPLIYDDMLFAQTVDYTAWRCVDEGSGKCSEVTNRGLTHNKEVFCGLNPLHTVPSEFYTPGTKESTANLSAVFIRGVNYTWTSGAGTYFGIRLGFYCENEKSGYMDMIYFGMLITGLLSGLLIDKLGRKPPLIISGTLGYLLVLVMIFVREYSGLAVIQVLHGIVYTMYMISSIIWLSENLPRQYRPLLYILYSSMVTFGRFIFAVLVTELPDWKDVTICILVLCMVSSCGVHFLPDSLQFLLSHHLDSEAGKALTKLSTKWQTYSKIFTLKTDSNRSHRSEDNLGALFTHKKVGYRVLIILFLWGITPLTLTSRTPLTRSLTLPVYYVIRASLCWVVQLGVVSAILLVRYERVFLAISLVLTAVFNMIALLGSDIALNLVVQVLSELSLLILTYLTIEVVPMPQRATVLGLGYSLQAIATLINLNYYTLNGDDVILRVIITCLLTLASFLCFLLPDLQSKLHPVSFSIGEAKKTIGKRTILISEKEVYTSTPPSSGPTAAVGGGDGARKSSSDTVSPAESDYSPQKMKYIVYNKADNVDRYIFLDKGNRRLDITFNKVVRDVYTTKTGKEKKRRGDEHRESVSSDSSLVIVNVYRDERLEKTFHQKCPSLVIDYDSAASDISDVYVVEDEALAEMIDKRGSPVYTVPVKKRRNPQSSATYQDIVAEGMSCAATAGSTNPSPDLSVRSGSSSSDPGSAIANIEMGEDGESDGTFEIVTPCSLHALTSVESGEQVQTIELSSEEGEDEEESSIPEFRTLRKFNTHMQLAQVAVPCDGEGGSDVAASGSGEVAPAKWRNVMGEVEKICSGGENIEYIRYDTPTTLPSPDSVQSQRGIWPRDRNVPMRITEWEFSVFDESPVHWFPLSSAGIQNEAFGSLNSSVDSTV